MPALCRLLLDEGVLLTVPIVSRDRRWGHVLMVPGRILGTLLSEEDVRTLEAFADQLALLLDAAGLLRRALAVERSLAHAEKLAAIGETAARIAHDIRNPVTAARSLAQQLCREAPGTLEEPLRVILAELERVERQVAAILRFARRDDLRTTRLDLGALVHATMEGARRRLDAAGIALDLALADGVLVEGDAETLRHTLQNLVDNAADALAGTPGARLSVVVENGHAAARLRVADNGPGVPPDVLPRLFEPFFSLKPTGTGLGLAIVKRTVEAHGGRVVVGAAAPPGLTVEIELPRAGAPTAGTRGMTDYGAIGLYLLPALVLVVLGRGWPTHPATLMAFSYASWAGFVLVPAALHRDPPPRLIAWYVAADVAMILSLAWFRHRVERESRPAGDVTRAWLLGNYGAAAAMSLFTATFPLLIPLPTLDQQLFAYRLVFLVYYTAMAALVLGALVRRGGAGVGLFALGVGLFPAGALLLGIAGATRLHPALIAAVGLTFTAPFAGPRLARVVRAALVAVACSAAAWIGDAAFTALGPLLTAPRAAADVTSAQLLAAALYALPAYVLGICARQEWIALRAGGSSAVLPRLVLVLVSAMTVACALMAFLWLCPLSLKSPPPNWLFAVTVLQNWCLLGAVAVAGHATRLAVNPTAPGAAWLVANYGSAAAVGVGSLLFFILPVGSPDTCTVAYLAVQQAYTGAMLLVLLLRFARASRAGGWWRGAGDYRAGRADAVTVAFALVGMVVWALVLFSAPPGWQPTPGKLVAIVLTTWTTTIPFAVRNLGAVVRGLLVLSTALVAAAAVHLGTQAFAAPIAAAGFERLAFLLTVVAFVAVLAPGSAWARAAIDRVVFRRSRRRRAELQAFVHGLSPDLGVVECCRRTLDRLVTVMRCRGAAVLLGDGEAVGAGLLALEPLRRAWPRDGVPARALVGYELGELPPALHGALREAGATGVVPIESPGRRWGHLVFGLRLLDTAFRDDDTQAIEAVADQLALVLDGTALLARAREVERSLAHAEKLGALGELAARIAHEIRNPVTAARSLAQQLRRERPSAPDDPAALILGELERVERQVAALLRFARREDLRLAPVDLGDLVRATLEAYRTRLESAGVGLELDVADDVVVAADAETPPPGARQSDRERHRRARRRRPASGASRSPSARTTGAARFAFATRGRACPPDRLPRLFEPFFTTKEHGTGLGLAIAKRTIDAHGGRISAAAAPGGGVVFTVQLPTVRSMEP